ncbi:MAG: hypothetical protein CO094_04705 [Anaerolineae bacterium CG_4_9_14_3_um_filter_57_17]|nr:glycosyltransferase family 4 protein [bacterium]OIO83516.1 MAG: hypothetical protein AUK01_12325 [Anaerolineae bacterium CG2_30_57_67]PJB67264.1 MAG: hypothetical protein CO094_04705 [Anaerolineae bacterium CG_4_9_14_3_um_filter_57_17]
MRILFVADGRSPITLNWLRHFTEGGHQVFLASTFDCAPPPGLAGFRWIPVAFSGAKKAPAAAGSLRRGIWGASALNLRTALRQWLGPLTLASAASALRAFQREIRPDLIHALRIPYEGMLAAQAAEDIPLVVSVWGNDFTLHAPATPLMRFFTTKTLRRADALLADCARDIRLARAWGFAVEKPTLVTPGNGGIRRDVFFPAATPPAEPVILNPRGFRAYVRNDTFFRAIPLVLREMPQAKFRCVGMADEPRARAWAQRLKIESALELLPVFSPAQMADAFRAAQVMVSPSTHDGTPNTLLEALACGCLPVASDLESIREWITPGENGLLVNAAAPQALAQAMLRGLRDADLRARAAAQNAALIAERGDYAENMRRVEVFYAQI